jgi:hypothetical protein
MLDDTTSAFLKFIKQVEFCRQKEREYYDAKKRHDMTTAGKLQPLVFELKRKIDRRCIELKELIQSGFQPELFR